MTVTTGDILHLAALLLAVGGLVWRLSALAADVRGLQKAIEKADLHVTNMPLIAQRLAAAEVRLEELGTRSHQMANHLQWALAKLDELGYPREPSRPDITIESPGRYPPRR